MTLLVFLQVIDLCTKLLPPSILYCSLVYSSFLIMRGLLKAASVLAPVLTSALVLPDRIALNSEWDDRPLGSGISVLVVTKT